MERPSNTVLLICNMSGGSYRHFIFRTEEADDVLFFPQKILIFRTEEETDISFFLNRNPPTFYFSAISQHWIANYACFISLHLVAYK
jgi:hypothetical protein